MIKVEGKNFSISNIKKSQLIEDINKFNSSFYMGDKEIELIERLLSERNTDRIVFRDKENKLSPLIYGDINIIGIFISKPGVVWLVDDTKIKSDIYHKIREFYYVDKHHLSSFTKDFGEELIKKINS